jgi:RHS repeat-associated protein
LGTPILATNINGTPTWKLLAEAYGETIYIEGVNSINLGFPGQYYDRETGRYYNFHRYFNPATGRYMEGDPIGLDGGLNLYSYVNPIINIDELGLKGKDCPWILKKVGLCGVPDPMECRDEALEQGSDCVSCVACCTSKFRPNIVEGHEFVQCRNICEGSFAGGNCPRFKISCLPVNKNV